VTARPATGATERHVPVLNIANVLTVLRILMVPVLVVVLFVDHGSDPAYRLGAAAVFFLAGITDHVDGQLARRLGLITEFGKLADPIADKALIGATMVSLSVLGEMSWWATGIIAVREIGITVLRLVVIRHGVIPASRGGKIKTLVQMLALFLLLLPLPDSVTWLTTTLVWVAVALTVATGLDYIAQAATLRRSAHRAAVATEAGAAPAPGPDSGAGADRAERAGRTAAPEPGPAGER